MTPIGNNVAEFWDGLLTGKNGVNPITHFDATGYKTTFACELKGFDVSKYMVPAKPARWTIVLFTRLRLRWRP